MNRTKRFTKRMVHPLRNEEGATLVFFGLMVLALFACFALAVDVGLTLNTRAEAQRAADAGALAGAGVFWGKYPAAAYATRARDTASIYTHRNYVGGAQASPDSILVDPVNRRVGVWVRHQPKTIFAQFFGIRVLDLGRVYAEAQIRSATSTRCVKPFAVPDLWSGAYNNGQPNTYPLTGEQPYYEQYDPMAPTNTATGYGSNGSAYGTRLRLALTSPSEAIIPSIALAMSLPEDPTMPTQCPGIGGGGGGGGGGGTTGRDQFRDNICNCNNRPFDLGVPKPLYTSSTSMLGNVYQGFRNLYDRDSGAYWDEGTQTIRGSAFADPLESPRVVKLALFPPEQLRDLRSGNANTITPNNVALFFLEWDSSIRGAGQMDAVFGRFLQFAGDGNMDGVSPGPNIQVLQLVK